MGTLNIGEPGRAFRLAVVGRAAIDISLKAGTVMRDAGAVASPATDFLGRVRANIRMDITRVVDS